MTNDTYPPSLADATSQLRRMSAIGVPMTADAFHLVRHIENLAADRAERGEVVRNQCDGCARGLPLNANGIHRGGSAWDAQYCTADRYSAPSSHAGDEALLRQCLEAMEWGGAEAVTIAVAALRERLAKEG